MKMNWSANDKLWTAHVYYTAWFIQGYGHEEFDILAKNETYADLAAREMFAAGHEHEEDIYTIENVFVSEFIEEDVA